MYKINVNKIKLINMIKKTTQLRLILAILLLPFAFYLSPTQAQSPQKMSYQAVIRNSSNALVVSHSVGMKISILQGSATGTEVYSETQTPTTNANGLVGIEIGGGAGFSTINWVNGPYFIKTETDPTGGTNYTITGTNQLLSVPYSLNAKTAETADYNNLSNLPALNIANWNTAYGWGNHASEGYLTSYTETDPVWSTVSTNYYTKTNMQTGGNSQLHFNNLTNKPTTVSGYGITDAMTTSHVANGITASNINNWNTAYGWGNHALAGYLTSFTELDPKVGANTANYISKWNGTALVTSTIFDNGANVGIGTSTPGAKLEVNGQLKITGGTPGNGKILTSDASGLASWQTPTGVTGTGTANYMVKWTTGGSVLGNSLIQDNGTGISINYGIFTRSQLFVYRKQLTSVGTGQATIMSFRDRDSQNNGSNYSSTSVNNAISGINLYGDVYSFAVGGFNYDDYTRCGGVFGGDVNGVYWGTLGYKSSAGIKYGVYGSTAYANGGGKSNTSAGIGVAGVGSLMGSWFRGQVYGSIIKGDRMSLYVDGKSYTNEVITQLNNNGSEQRFATYVATSMTVDVYMKGKGQLVNGKAEIKFDPNYQSMISDKDPIIVTVTPIGKSNSIYIEEIKGDGFSVAENNDGKSNVVFTWIAVATRKGYENPNNPVEIMDTKFDKNLNNFMFNESDTKNAAQPMWWDGTKINYTPVPQEPIIKKELIPEIK